MNDLTKFIDCPFCHEHDFDKYGLKHHLQNGYCEVYEEIQLVQRPQAQEVGDE